MRKYAPPRVPCSRSGVSIYFGATGDHFYKVCFIMQERGRHGPNDENEKENGTEGIKREP
jgi:hypothetical protein